MTLSKNAIVPPAIPLKDDTKDGEVPIRYPVMVLRERVTQMVPRRVRWDYLYGTIVTHLSLDHYCTMHGLKLMQLYRGWRPALAHERTELF